MKWVKQNSEVLYPEKKGVLGIAKSDITQLVQISSENARQRVRYCTHNSVDDMVHEMFICHRKGTYIRPHKHLGKAESFHLIKGAADVVFFDEKGNIENMLSLGPYGSGKMFYYRVSRSVYHTQIFHENTVYHETTRGPFEKKETVFPNWAPLDIEDSLAHEYLKKLMFHLRELYPDYG